MSKDRRAHKAPEKKGGLYFLFMDRTAPAQVPYGAVIAPLLIFAAAISYFQICSPDLWWHLKTGEWVWQQRAIPQGDPFSFTAAGKPWIAHEWLFGVLVFLAFKAVGLAGLIALKTSIIAALLALTAWTARIRGAAAGMTLMVLAGAFAISRPRFDERPELISLCLAVSYLLIFEKGREHGRVLILLPFLQLLWTNLHGGTALLGWGLAGAFLLDHIWELRKPGLPWYRIAFGREMHGHLGACAGVVALSFANPYAVKALTYGMLRAESPLRIEEFQSLAARMRLGPELALTMLLAYAILLTAFCIFRPRQVRVFEWLLLPAMLILCLSFYRFRSLFAILLAPSLARHLSQGKRLGRLRWWIPALAALILLIRMAADDSRSYGYRFGAGVHAGVLPVEAAEFVKTAGISGRVLNEYEFGGYLIWHLGSELKVFIDGREDVYVQPGIAADYSSRFRSAEGWRELTARYGIDYVMIKYPEAPPPRPELSLESLAFPRSDWALVHFDDLAVIYVRRNGKNDHVIRHKEIKAVQPLQLSSYLDEIVKNPEKQQRFLQELNDNLRERPESFRSHFLMGIFAIKRGPQFWPQAVKEFRQTVAVNPEYVPAYLNLGNIHRQLGQFAEAKKAYRQALKLRENPAVRQQLNLMESHR